MDHNLDDSLNLESAIGVDFEQTEDLVVSQSDISLDASGHEGDIPMEFEHIEEQPMLMDTGNEEIIEFIGDQFSLQEYSVQDDHAIGGMTTVESNQQQKIISSQADTMIDLQVYQQQVISSSAVQQVHELPKIVHVKAAMPTISASSLKKEPIIVNTVPRQVAIAPKPPALVQIQKSNLPKQYAIAPKPVPKPVALVANRSGIVKKVTLANVQGSPKGNSVLAQIGKQLVMVPTGGTQKFKLVTGSGTTPTVQYIRTDSDQTQLITTKSQSSKPVMTKFIVQGQQNSELANQAAVITKILPAVSTGTTHTRYVTMQQKTVPISKVLVASPTKSTVKITKKQQATVKSPTPKLLPAPPQGATTKKVVITANPTQNVILKTTAPPKTAEIIKDGNIINVTQAQSSQLHQINVPGKGIQYIRLITNSTAAAATKPVVAKSQTSVLVPSRTLVLTDKVAAKPQQKFVRIAPVVSKASNLTTTTRSAQSLLAPISSAPMEQVTFEKVIEPVHKQEMVVETVAEEEESKVALRALIADTVGGGEGAAHGHGLTAQEVEVEFERHQSPEQDENSYVDEHDSNYKPEDRPLIVISSNYLKQQDNNMIVPDNGNDDSNLKNNMFKVNVEAESLNSYKSPRTPQALSETDLVSTDLGLRPRKACNCTKSQCLKLYCDCFANGVFCNSCNCSNCHNNLEKEGLRQKAIRGCLDRNPNAFRPKIGKTKCGGPEIVRRHNKGCNCKRSGCLKNYCECYEAKIACTAICKCVGCRNVEESVERARRRDRRDQRDLRDLRDLRDDARCRRAPHHLRQPCSFMTSEVIEAVCQCLVAAAAEEGGGEGGGDPSVDPVGDVIEEFARCLQDIINASQHNTSGALVDEGCA